MKKTKIYLLYVLQESAPLRERTIFIGKLLCISNLLGQSDNFEVLNYSTPESGFYVTETTNYSEHLVASADVVLALHDHVCSLGFGPERGDGGMFSGKTTFLLVEDRPEKIPAVPSYAELLTYRSLDDISFMLLYTLEARAIENAK